MPCERYVVQRFNRSSVNIINQANTIIAEYQAAGFTLTLRQLYYQFVARGLLPNQQKQYKRLGSILNDARLAGHVDWDAIEDRTRNLRGIGDYASPADAVRSAAQGYRVDRWADQPVRVEVWIEKDALVGVVQPVCHAMHIEYFACRGYSSQSEQWRAGRRFRWYAEQRSQKTVVLHLGDHDPSGIDMTRDNDERLFMFAGDVFELRRLALNMDQVQVHNPPPNPAKETDARHHSYVRRFGDKSWELDALDPKLIDGLIRDELDKLMDKRKWKKTMKREAEEKARLERTSALWNRICGWMDNEAHGAS